jgi:hypothetical protein
VVGVKDEVSAEDLALRRADAPNIWDDVRLQKLWLAADRSPWRSLAVVGGGPSVETFQVAELLAQLAWRYRGQPSNVIDLRDLSMRLIDYEVQEMRTQVASGARVIVALRSVFENPTAAPIAQQADAVVLCIKLGQTTLKAARDSVSAIGRKRILGSIVLRGRVRTGAPRTGGR